MLCHVRLHAYNNTGIVVVIDFDPDPDTDSEGIDVGCSGVCQPSRIQRTR